MTNLLTQITILNDSTGKKKISFTYDTVNNDGTTAKSNQKKSFIVMDGALETTVKDLETSVTDAMNAQ